MLGNLWGKNRRNLRRAVSFRCEVVTDPSFERISDKGIDISAGGMLVHTDSHVEVGTPVIVSFALPQSRIFMDAIGSVSRVVSARRKGDEGMRVALRFEQFDAVSKAFLEGRLAGTPPPMPARPVRPDYALGIQPWVQAIGLGGMPEVIDLAEDAFTLIAA
jgi:hypothetical protein